MHGGGSAPSCCAFSHRVAFEEGSGPRVLLKSGPGSKKNRDTKGTFHANMGSIKDRNGVDITEAHRSPGCGQWGGCKMNLPRSHCGPGSLHAFSHSIQRPVWIPGAGDYPFHLTDVKTKALRVYRARAPTQALRYYSLVSFYNIRGFQIFSFLFKKYPPPFFFFKRKLTRCFTMQKRF